MLILIIIFIFIVFSYQLSDISIFLDANILRLTELEKDRKHEISYNILGAPISSVGREGVPCTDALEPFAACHLHLSPPVSCHLSEAVLSVKPFCLFGLLHKTVNEAEVLLLFFQNQPVKQRTEEV